MIGERENDRCYFCGGRLASESTTIPFIVASKVVIVKNVPAQVCAQCGEPVLGGEVAADVERLLKQARQSGYELSILNYEHVELVRV